jgi:hypothetical protein
MRPFDVIKHSKCLDAAFLIKKVMYRGVAYTKVRGWWVNVSTSNARIIDHNPETITITAEQLPSWKVIEVVGL